MQDQGSEDAPLTDLCAICHSNPPKYKCPRCYIKTCSLPCIKRHKLVSECSGLRDPAAYKRRKELATETSFDQDFNFISGLERSLERADRDASNRGIPLEGGQRPIRGEYRFNVELERSGVSVRKAPVGMSRNKQNKSHWNQRHKHISWTVEWIMEDGQKIFANCLESITIQQAFVNAVPKKLQQSRKRKLDDAETQAEQEDSSKNVQDPESQTGETVTGEEMMDELKAADKEFYFYLHRPDQPNRQRSVTYITPSSVLGDVLRGSLVLEFPTIYVLPYTSNHLPETFVLTEKSPADTNNISTDSVEPETEINKTTQSEEKEVNEDQILDALNQDLGT